MSRLKRRIFYKERFMRLSTQVYEAFRDDEAKAKVLADVIEQLEAGILDADVATRYDLNKTELTLLKEIEQNRANFAIELAKVKGELTKEIEKVRADFAIELEKVRGEIKDTELSLRKEIEQLRADFAIELEKVRGEIKECEMRLKMELEKTKAELTSTIHGNSVSGIRWLVALMITQLLAMSGLIVGLFQYFGR